MDRCSSERVQYDALAQNAAGLALCEEGRLEDAAVCYRQALSLDPFLPQAHRNLAVVLKATGRPVEAILHHQTALRIMPADPAYRMAFADCLRNLPLTNVTDALQEDLLATFERDDIDHQDLAFATASVIRHSRDFESLSQFVERNAEGSLADLLEAGLASLASNALFLALLEKTIVRDAVIERVLTEMRRALLDAASETHLTERIDSGLRSFIFALSHQCFSNEYVYAVLDVEGVGVGQLQAQVTAHTQPILLALLACYIPLSALQRDELFISMLANTADDRLVSLITRQVTEPLEERESRAEILSVGVIADEVSRRVRAQYEENPYPRWLRANAHAAEPLRHVLKRSLPDVRTKHIPDIEEPAILIAGCGTGQHLIDRALGVEGARVLGLDVSLSSLSYAKRKAGELRLPNVEFIHADLLNVRALNREFDVIECIGVLHHMAAPEDGWRALAACLKPGGLMRVGLYSEKARADIVAAQEFVAANGYAPEPAGIRRCRGDIFGLPDDAIVKNVTRIVDFYTLSETRDLIFHVHENRFTLLQIGEIVGRLGLKFIGFELGRSDELKKYRQRFPDDYNGTSLQNWHQYEDENPEAFIGLYVFWLRNAA